MSEHAERRRREQRVKDAQLRMRKLLADYDEVVQWEVIMDAVQQLDDVDTFFESLKEWVDDTRKDRLGPSRAGKSLDPTK
jgi:hypothetical protein